MLVNKKLGFTLLFLLSSELNLWEIAACDRVINYDGGSGSSGDYMKDGDGTWAADKREWTGSELRRRTRSSSGRGDSKGSESEIEITPPSRVIPKLRDLLPNASDIHQELVLNWQALKDGKATNYDRLSNLVERFTDPRARKHFPVLIPYGTAGGSSFAIYAVQTKQPEALKFLATVEDFTVSDQIYRTPLSVARELAVKDASYCGIITALEELQAARFK